ncbi:hypothetical protein Hypma_003142 [Hypsizygus marmoreus]|uniref:Uncharacterized protein n=1 Tax=Hypsizygus marmoreus TaxID=39966 RepID=A0A369J8Z0_HYPMA|nr:hypothetical protein Hypma_003142 [Hypsizygus marmoreus]
MNTTGLGTDGREKGIIDAMRRPDPGDPMFAGVVFGAAKGSPANETSRTDTHDLCTTWKEVPSGLTLLACRMTSSVGSNTSSYNPSFYQ